MSNYCNENGGRKHILNVVDTIFNYAWVKSLKKKNDIHVPKSFGEVIVYANKTRLVGKYLIIVYLSQDIRLNMCYY